MIPAPVTTRHHCFHCLKHLQLLKIEIVNMKTKPPYVIVYEPRGNLSSGFPTRLDSNRPAQLQRQARVLKFWI